MTKEEMKARISAIKKELFELDLKPEWDIVDNHNYERLSNELEILEKEVEK